MKSRIFRIRMIIRWLRNTPPYQYGVVVYDEVEL
jgi:hypothetical protein